MLNLIAQQWWVLAVRGLVAILFGLVALFQPGIALTVIAVLFACYALLDGILSLVAASRKHHQHGRWWMLAFEGVAGILFAIATFIWPAITILVFVYILAAWAVVTGFFEVGAALHLRRHLKGEWLLILAGVFSIVFGIALVVAPMAGAIVLAWWIGIYGIIFGITMLLLAFRLRRTLYAASAAPGLATR